MDQWHKLKKKLGNSPKLPSIHSYLSKAPRYEEIEKDWYHSEEWSHVIDPKQLVLHVIRLFNDPASLKKYSNDQVNQGFYYICLGAEVDLPTCLANASVPLPDRIRCIQSFEKLYKYIFRKRKVPDAARMWWDWFIVSRINYSKSSKTQDKIKIREVMFGTLVKILKFRSEDCQHGALHGLEHLKPFQSDKVNKALNKFLKSGTPVNKSVRRYAEKIIARKNEAVS